MITTITIKKDILAEFNEMQQLKNEPFMVYITVAEDGELLADPHHEYFKQKESALLFVAIFNNQDHSDMLNIKECVEKIKQLDQFKRHLLEINIFENSKSNNMIAEELESLGCNLNYADDIYENDIEEYYKKILANMNYKYLIEYSKSFDFFTECDVANNQGVMKIIEINQF